MNFHNGMVRKQDGKLRWTFKYLTKARLRVKGDDLLGEVNVTGFSTPTRLRFPKLPYFKLTFRVKEGNFFNIM